MKISSCKNCDSQRLSYRLFKRTNPEIQDGRLRCHDISIIAVLGCDECGESLDMLKEHEIEYILSNWIYQQ